MKKQILSLMLGAIVIATNPTFAMNEEEETFALNEEEEPKGPPVSRSLSDDERAALFQRLNELQQVHKVASENLVRIHNLGVRNDRGVKTLFLGLHITPETQRLDEILSKTAKKMKKIENQLGIEGNFTDAAVKKRREMLGTEIIQEMLGKKGARGYISENTPTDLTFTNFWGNGEVRGNSL